MITPEKNSPAHMLSEGGQGAFPELENKLAGTGGHFDTHSKKAA